MILLILFLGCSSDPKSMSSTSQRAPTQQAPTSLRHNDTKHPPIPANLSIWQWDAKGFVPDFGWYGEHSWSGVRMRVLGQLAIAYRLLARSHIENGSWEKGLKAYQQLEKELVSLSLEQAPFAKEIQEILLQATKRDIEIIHGITKQKPFPQTTGFSALRIRYYKLATESSPDRAEILQLQKDILHFLERQQPLNIEQFSDFTDRHRLRVQLFQQYVDVIDPIANADFRWGYWEADEIKRQALSLGLALENLGGEAWQDKAEDWRKEIARVSSNDIFTASEYSKQLQPPSIRANFSILEFGSLPTGDTLIDSAGEPGPKAIGRLEKLDVSDPHHAQWLEEQTIAIASLMKNNPPKALQQCKKAISILDDLPHGSRFYNIKQFRNACTRQFARLGLYEQALEIHQSSFPLHNQDWACPNREALLLILSAQLHLANHNLQKGREDLRKAIQQSQQFLNNVSLAEQNKLKGPVPPSFSQQRAPNRNRHNQQNETNTLRALSPSPSQPRRH